MCVNSFIELPFDPQRLAGLCPELSARSGWRTCMAYAQLLPAGEFIN
jgi:hypothetical protein